MAEEPRPDEQAAQARHETRALNIRIRADLHVRMGQVKATTTATLTAQVEEALDEWLTRKGY
ncbi:MAG TPA: hypothetical protein VIP77_06835 [Jiangellaceae bacterium]